jgi:hypothetical protein
MPSSSVAELAFLAMKAENWLKSKWPPFLFVIFSSPTSQRSQRPPPPALYYIYMGGQRGDFEKLSYGDKTLVVTSEGLKEILQTCFHSCRLVDEYRRSRLVRVLKLYMGFTNVFKKKKKLGGS